MKKIETKFYSLVPITRNRYKIVMKIGKFTIKNAKKLGVVILVEIRKVGYSHKKIYHIFNKYFIKNRKKLKLNFLQKKKH